jgi:hypothetical protein
MVIIFYCIHQSYKKKSTPSRDLSSRRPYERQTKYHTSLDEKILFSSMHCTFHSSKCHKWGRWCYWIKGWYTQRLPHGKLTHTFIFLRRWMRECKQKHVPIFFLLFEIMFFEKKLIFLKPNLGTKF